MNKSLQALVLGVAMSLSAGIFAQNSNPQIADPSMSSWMATHKGRITKQEYMDEASRRWDKMDTNRQGLTSSQINSMYGGAPTPNMVKEGNSRTNPTGTEAAGQNSGGK